MLRLSRRFRDGAVFCAATLAVGVPLLAGCSGKGTQADVIGRVLNDPNAFMNKDLTIAGRVTNRLDPTGGLLGLAAYQVDDGSGKIWVVTHAGVPEVGDKVALKAHLRRDPLPVATALPINVTLLDELERKQR